MDMMDMIEIMELIGLAELTLQPYLSPPRLACPTRPPRTARCQPPPPALACPG